MPAKTYRYYCLDGVGNLHGAEWFEADSDDHAVSLIREMHPDGTCEIWQVRRLVATIEPQRLTA